MKRVIFLFSCFLILGFGLNSWSADIYVSPAGGGTGATPGDPTDLQTALDTARTNGQDDMIYLQTGSYDASTSGAAAFEYGPTSNDNMAVTLSGGWNSDYTSQSDDPSLTLLDGGNDSRVLEIVADSTGITITFTLENLTIQNGQSSNVGGGIYAYTGVAGSGNYGNIDLTLTNCLVRNNDSDSNGGGWYSNCYFEIYDSNFSGNTAGNGGAMIFYYKPDYDYNLAPLIENTTFYDNSNDGNQGSAIYNTVSPVVSNCLFDSNHGFGSPIYNTTYSNPTISDSTFVNNDIIYWGGAIQFWDAGGNIVNCIFYNNIAGNGGSGYAAVTYYEGGGGGDIINITNCTFENNTGDYSNPRSDAIHNRGGIFNITNSIFWNNSGTAGLYNVSGHGGTITVSYSDLQGGVPTTIIDGGNNINLDPAFVGGGDNHLTIGSPCIDVGDNTATYLPGKDFEGDDRKIDGDKNGSKIVDMGADEYNSGPVPDIKANGSDSPITIARGTPLSVTVDMDPGDYKGDSADYWCVVSTPFPAPNDWYYYPYPAGIWTPGRETTFQGPIRKIPSMEILNMSNLPAGTYIFYFGVDTNMNGNINLSEAFYDRVRVTITN
jgi:hypothetical protein